MVKKSFLGGLFLFIFAVGFISGCVEKPWVESEEELAQEDAEENYSVDSEQ
jgi:hypothetical protein